MLKRAAMAGLNAAGVNVRDLEVASVPPYVLTLTSLPTTDVCTEAARGPEGRP